MKVPFLIPPSFTPFTSSGDYEQRIEELVTRKYSLSCTEILKNKFYPDSTILLTGSCTHALELAIRAAGLKPGDEVILPSFNYVSGANACVLAGVTPVFCDISEKTLCAGLPEILPHITTKTRAILTVHYASASSDMEELKDYCQKKSILLIEDAAHCPGATFKNKELGSFGDFACLSFGYSKNLSCGEGGALLINNTEYVKSATVAYENGTNRADYHKGLVSKYEWIAPGSNYYPSDYLSIILNEQLVNADTILNKRKSDYNLYLSELSKYIPAESLSMPSGCDSSLNGHIVYILTKDTDTRRDWIQKLEAKGIQTRSHYEPLHASAYGQRFVRSGQTFQITEKMASSILRLPIYQDITEDQILYVCREIVSLYQQ